MKAVRHTVGAARDLKRHGNVAAPIRKAPGEYAADPLAHANNVAQLVGSTAWRLRVGGFRVMFENGEAEITVTRVGPRGGTYD